MKDSPEDLPQCVSQISLVSPDYSFEEFCFQMITGRRNAGGAVRQDKRV
jgi:hypothetical protein